MKLAPLAFFAALAATPALSADTAAPDLEALKWVARPIVVFAPSPADPRLAQQLDEFEAQEDELVERDVVIVVDSDDSELSELRRKFRPRDFMVLVIGKDGQVKYRKPNPVTVREVIRLIDRMPLRRQELRATKGQFGG